MILPTWTTSLDQALNTETTLAAQPQLADVLRLRTHITLASLRHSGSPPQVRCTLVTTVPEPTATLHIHIVTSYFTESYQCSYTIWDAHKLQLQLQLQKCTSAFLFVPPSNLDKAFGFFPSIMQSITGTVSSFHIEGDGFSWHFHFSP